MSTLLKSIAVGIATALCLIGSGCTTAEMKGTPLYTGEYGKRRGPAEQRVNAWPLLYYRDPALSVLWPMFELTDDHAAVRPFFSVYGLDHNNREYNVLWPLAQFDRQSRENHILPVYWSSNHFVVFPLYWHYGQPWGTNGGSDSFFPLWVLNRKGSDKLSVWALWPLVHHARDEKDGAESSMGISSLLAWPRPKQLALRLATVDERARHERQLAGADAAVFSELERQSFRARDTALGSRAIRDE